MGAYSFTKQVQGGPGISAIGFENLLLINYQIHKQKNLLANKLHPQAHIWK